MNEYRLKRLKDGAKFKMLCKCDKRAQEIIGEFIRQSEVKCMWQVDTVMSRRSNEILTPQSI